MPQYVDKSSLHHYGYPSSTAFFGPRDLDNIIRAWITPFHFVISGNRMSVGITTWETRRGDIEEEFLKTRIGIPENAFEMETFRDTLRASYYLFKAPRSGPRDNFDMFE